MFVNETTARVNETIELTGIDIVQLHGQEPPEYCQKLERKVIKAFRIASNFNLEQVGAYKVDAYLLDTCVKGIYGVPVRVSTGRLPKEQSDTVE
ncbi:MAG: hypothetical protein J7J76_09420 [Candidatus Latescibacteria bacterium]|nr:hypothetical protein [Candidatus Latescibacterota bacterium]